MLQIAFRALKRNVNDVAFEKIWFSFPEVVNKGYLKISFVEDIIKTLSTLKKKGIISEKIWKGIEKSFSKFENKEV